MPTTVNITPLMLPHVHGRHGKDVVVLHETVSSDIAGLGDINAIAKYLADKDYGIHGITEDDVKDAPKFPEVYKTLCGLLGGQIVAHHGGFDRIAFSRATDKYGLSTLDCSWLDTTKVVRRTWPDRKIRSRPATPAVPRGRG